MFHHWEDIICYGRKGKEISEGPRNVMRLGDDSFRDICLGKNSELTILISSVVSGKVCARLFGHYYVNPCADDSGTLRNGRKDRGSIMVFSTRAQDALGPLAKFIISHARE